MHSLRTSLALLLSILAAPPAHPQTFAQPKVIPTGNWPTAVYTADINADGYSDLIYIDAGATPQASTTHVLLNDGTGNFTQSATLATAGISVAIGDLTGNGHVDLGWFSQRTDPTGVTEYLKIASGKGDGTFAAPVNYGGIGQVGPGPFLFINLVAGRLHDSGTLDIIAQEPTNKLVYAIRANPALHSLLSVSFGSLPDGTGAATVADLNNDGHGDLLIDGFNASSAQIFLGNGNGLSQAAPNPATPNTRFSGTSGVHSLLIQDVNYDGVPDLIAEGTAGHIDVFPGNGDGTFQTASIGGTGLLDGTTGNGGHLIVAADLNNDNLLDALTITPAGVSTLLGQGTQYLGLKAISNAGPTGGNGHPSYVTADFNGDGFLDLAVDSPEGIAILFGVGDGTFQTSQAFAAGAPAQSATLGTFTASGHLDAAVSINSAQAQLLLGQGDGTFLAAPAPTITQAANPALWSTIAAGDFNNDGKLDLAITADGPAAHLPTLGVGTLIQYGLGNGTFTVPPYISSHGNPGSGAYFGTAIAGPGLGLSGHPGLINLDPNHLWTISDSTQPPGPYATDIATLTDPHAHNLVAAGPLHGGTLPDLIVQDEGSLKLYLNSPTGYAPTPAGDLSIDGSLTTPGRAVAPALGPTFGGTVPTSSGGLGFPAAIGSMVIADLDGDGDNDLLVAYDNMAADHAAPNQNTAPNYLYIWYGSGGGKFLATARHPVNPLILTPARNDYQLAIADLNGDKIPDLIMSDGYVITVAYGVGDGTFGAEKHFLAGQGINTVSVGDVNGDGIPDLVLANGGAVLTNPVASHETLATNPDVNTGGITVLLNQTPQAPPPAPTSLALALCVDDPGSLFPCGTPLSNTPLVNPITMYFGQVLDGVAVESSTNLAGTITFYDGTRVFCTIPANLTGAGPMGNACPTNAGNFHAGNRSVDAVYSGDATHAPSTSNSIQVRVFPDLTTSAIVSSLNPATAGQPVTFTATVTGNFAIPYGTVDFFDLVTPIGSSTLDATGHATFTTSTLAVGSHPISVAYQGNSDFNPVAAPLALLTQIIKPAAITQQPTTTYLVAIGPTTIYFNQPANSRYYTTVADPSHPPTGTVTVQDNGVSIPYCTAIPYGTTCPYAAGGSNRLTVGTHSLVVLYNGDPLNAPSASAPLVFTVLPATSAATLVSSLNPAPLGASVTFTATLTGNPVLPTGSIAFFDGATLLATTSLDATGNATYTTGTLALGTHPITVVYAGNTSFTPATSAVLNQVIVNPIPTPPPPGTFTLTVTPSPITIPVGRTGLLVVTITANGSFAQPVALTCATTTPETSCDFILPTIPVGGGSTTFELHTSAPHDCGDPNHPYFLGSCTAPPAQPSTHPTLNPRAAALLPAGLLLCALGFKQSRRRLRTLLNSPTISLLLLTLSLIGLTTLSGCGVCTDLGTQGGRYTFTITATAQGGPVTETQSQTVPLTVIIP